MNNADLSSQLLFLALLIVISGFFSGSETAMMALNRYRLRTLAKKKHKAAVLAQRLLERPDRLIGLILIGNNFVNILASTLAGIIAVQLWGDAGIWIATISLTLVILVFAEVTPKTLAAYQPERFAFPAAYVLNVLLWLLRPIVFMVNSITGSLVKMLGLNPDEITIDRLSTDELRTVVREGSKIPLRRQGMLLNILDLENVRINDILVPRSDIQFIDIEDDMDNIRQIIRTTQHTRLPVCRGEVNQVIGILHMRNATRFVELEEHTKAALLQETHEPYFIPESTALHTQLFNFQKEKQRLALVVDEYGEIVGMIALEDILEEIVGEFTTDFSDLGDDIHQQDDDSFVIDGGAFVRDINRNLAWKLPTKGPKTLNGLILEHLEAIPDGPVGIKVNDYIIEVKHIKDNMIRTARVLVAPQPKIEG